MPLLAWGGRLVCHLSPPTWTLTGGESAGIVAGTVGEVGIVDERGGKVIIAKLDGWLGSNRFDHLIELSTVPLSPICPQR